MDSLYHLNQEPPNMSKVPGGWLIEATPPLIGCKAAPTVTFLRNIVHLVNHLVHEESCDAINRFVEAAPAISPVSIQGMQEVTDETIGSWRTTMFNRSMARMLEYLLEPVAMNTQIYVGPMTPTDWWQGDKTRRLWRYVGISPMLRWMKYKRGGRHAVHYDAGYIYPDDNYRTLYSFVLYLSTNQTGATRIISDGQEFTPVWDRDHSDWTKEATPGQVVAKNLPQKGSMLIFPHRMPHDVEEFSDANSDRIIMRGDLVFKAV